MFSRHGLGNYQEKGEEQMNEFLMLMSGGVGVAIVSGIFMLINARNARKAEEKAASTKITEAAFKEFTESLNDIKGANVVIVRDRIKYLARLHIKAGKVSFDERQDLIQLYDVYRERLHANGNIVALMEQFMKIPYAG